jgi:hypothetical protein
MRNPFKRKCAPMYAPMGYLTERYYSRKYTDYKLPVVEAINGPDIILTYQGRTYGAVMFDITESFDSFKEGLGTQ